MKKLTLLLLALIIFNFPGIAQRIALSGSATIDPPKTLYKLQKKEILSLASKRFGKTKYLAKRIQNNADKVYLVDDVVVFINSVSMPRTPGYLKDVKLAFDETGLLIPDYSSKIEMIGGKHVFIIDQVSEGLKLYRFTTVNKAQDLVVMGFVQYKPGDERKARTVLEELMKGLKFE